MCCMLQREGGDTRLSGPQIPKGLKVKLIFKENTELFRIMGRGVTVLLLEAATRQNSLGMSKKSLVRTDTVLSLYRICSKHQEEHLPGH